MTIAVIADTNILSSFLISEVEPLLFKSLNVEIILIPPAVSNELLVNASLVIAKRVNTLLDSGQLVVEAVDEIPGLPISFGAGEREAISLVTKHSGLLLTNDKSVVNYCKRAGILNLNLIGLMRLLWKSGAASQDEVRSILTKMNEREGLVIKNIADIFA